MLQFVKNLVFFSYRWDRMKIFNVTHDDCEIRLQTKHTKLSSLERLMLLIAREFISKGKSERLRKILSTIEALLIN